MATIGTQFVPIGIPTSCQYNLVPNLMYILSKRYDNASHTFWQDQSVYPLWSVGVNNAFLSLQTD